jgi:hypothetical protein
MILCQHFPTGNEAIKANLQSGFPVSKLRFKPWASPPRPMLKLQSVYVHNILQNNLIAVDFEVPHPIIQGGSNITGTNCDFFTHK